MQGIKAFLLLYIIATGFMYYLSYRGKNPILLPGDFYIKRFSKVIYIPIGSSLIVATILYAALAFLRKLILP